MILRLLLPHERFFSSLVFATVAHSAPSLGKAALCRDGDIRPMSQTTAVYEAIKRTIGELFTELLPQTLTPHALPGELPPLS
jgi:hypothetical protein